eukprot:5887772-Pleurochrysis_carterae.AAC.1
MGYEWTEEEEEAFEVAAVIGKVVTDGQTAYANQELLMEYYAQSLAADAAADEASASKDAEFVDLEELERVPAAR